MTLVVLAGIILVGSAGAMFYIQHQFNAINQLSTPPPVVSGRVFDDGASGDISTDPAQRVLEAAETGQTGEFSIGGSGVPGGAAPQDGIVDLTGDSPATVVAGSDNAPQAPATFTLKPVRDTEDGSLNVLLMGVDARPGEPIDIDVRPDSLSVLHLDKGTGACRILAIPRDTRTELPGYGQTKINHALAVGGIPYEMLVVEQLLGIKLDHYGLIDFVGVEELVDAVSGITVDNPEAFEHEGTSFAQGQIELDGEEALTYARYRNGADGDFGRQQRQQDVIRALIAQTSGMDVVRGANKLLGAVDKHFKTDLSPTEMTELANDYRTRCTAESLETARFEGVIETHPDPLLNLNLSYVILDPRDIETNVDWLLEDE